MDIQSIVETMSGNMVAKLNRIRLFLNEGRASVMVGAGFSRNAEKEAHVVMKDWNSLAEDIYEQLYSKKPTQKDLAFKTPMRLASLLASNVGRSGLDQVIKDSLPDDLISPGKIHYQLMALNWRDVFTTNYDTLLERAAEKSGRYYNVVTTKEMLLYKTSPRIIKLHGSFPDKTPFLMTEEEFRSYPNNHPEFVNTVRQALVESIFCLIGFSGDDPNFTSWQAWLRDVMGDYASPTYLITYDDKYDESFKKLMSSRGVEVINLAEIKGLKDYKSALEFFFLYLGQKTIVKWNPQGNTRWKTDDVEKMIQQLKTIRESYPGWFVLPKDYFDGFYDMNVDFPYYQAVVDGITDNLTKEKLLYELDWRLEISMTFKDHDWYIQSIEGLIEKYGDSPFSEEMMTLALSLLRMYRHRLDKKKEREKLLFILKSRIHDMTEGQKRRYYYISAGNLLSELDYESLISLLHEWQPQKNDYDGIIYKALIIAETKGVSDASMMIGEALERVSRVLLIKTSEELLSRKSALEFLLSFYSNEKRPDIPSKYSFIASSEKIMGDCRSSNPSNENVTHGFAIGSERKTWSFRSGINPYFLFPYRYLLLCERYGLPYGLPNNSIDYKLLTEIVEYLSGFGFEYTIPIALRSGSRMVAETALSRKVLSSITREQSEMLTKNILSIIKKTTRNEALTYRITEVLLPILCRLSTKVSGKLKSVIFEEARIHFIKNDSKANADICLLYDATMPEDMPPIIDKVFSHIFELNRSGQDFPYPSIGYGEFIPKDRHLSIVLDGLKSDNEEMVLPVLLRMERLLKSKITEEQRTTIKTAVVDWRKTAKANKYYWLSFAVVEYDKSELTELRNDICHMIEKFSEIDYSFNGSSLDISSMTDELKKFIYVASLLQSKQTVVLFNRITRILNDNKLTICNDDSTGFMGGMRKFFFDLFIAIRQLVQNVNLNEIDKDVCINLFHALASFTNCNLPVRIVMERLNNYCHAVKVNKMREVIEISLFKENHNIINDSLNALILHTNNGGNVQTIYQRIIHYCATDITESTNKYIDCLAYSELSKLTKKTKYELGRMMTVLYERIPTSNLPVEYKVDLTHSCVALLKVMQTETGVSSIHEASKLWLQYVNNPETFDDVKRVYFE